MLFRSSLLTVTKNTNMLMDYPGSITEWPSAELKSAKKKHISRALKRLVEDGTFGQRTEILSKGKGEDDIVVIDYNVQDRLQQKKTKKLPG